MNENFKNANHCSIDCIPNLGTLLVVAPHQDDESLGCGGTIAQAIKAGYNVEVIFITDGSQSHPGSQKYPFEKLVKLRQHEALSALSILGVKQPGIHFMNLPDGNLPGKSQPDFERCKSQTFDLLMTIKPATILLPWRRDPHPDHRATWDLVTSALRLTDFTPQLFEYFIWLYERASAQDMPLDHEGELFSIDIEPSLDTKSKAILAHTSQTTNLINDDENGFVLSSEMLDHFNNPKEYFIKTNASMENKEQSLPADYFDEVYLQKEDPWDLATSSYERDKYDTTVAALPRAFYDNALEIGCSIGVLTEKLIQKCRNILAIDIADAPIAQAKFRMQNYPQAKIEKMSVPNSFPEELFDLIIMSEVGYFFSIKDLDRLQEKIVAHLKENGQLLLVHWTPYVPDFPLTGDLVHDFFMERSGKEKPFRHLTYFRAEKYRLDLFEKH
ncbi:bifunctional PIG-L family deacetylase/class I SAM-dependent methyltransferase [Mucilaginibacter aquaedulcis]|uniref:bifunctional PIG-L family deacetylase/class I SAM-dependent methyltransferase n=1 Tax=Mucilaginibacter aquaedulcis TaxID=1187081 RepID=UPI0025B2B2C9|nr:bifunctional PIG-L family deacetylase/class I SAM-dependent methyltransferase [Mucilaginibacter aquaedulcis]MDN3550206.1 bifunctional PIG-L family deacetylase/class I SAM-dependent methyltransferase [Mucilaginibacter aquaedulcis]